MFIGQVDIVDAPLVPTVGEGGPVELQLKTISPVDPQGEDLLSRAVRAGPPGWVRWLAALIGIAASTRALLKAR